MKRIPPYTDEICRLFERPGAANTRAVLELAARRAERPDIAALVIPTHSGKSALWAAKMIAPSRIVAVTPAWGAQKPNTQAVTEAMRRRLLDMGVRVVTGTHALGGVGRAVRRKLGAYQMDEIIAYTLRLFGQGTKVAVEAALMAADAGAVRTDEDVIAAGGSSSGLDTALVLRPVNASSLLDMKIREIICKPSDF